TTETTETTVVTETTTEETTVEEIETTELSGEIARDITEEAAAALATDTAAMSNLYTRYAHESMTFSADIDADVQEIHRVCSGAAADESALASLLLSKTTEQRYLIWWRYRLLYKQSLTELVKSKSDYGTLLEMLASPLELVEAEILHTATRGLGVKKEWIYPVVMTRSNSDIALLKKTFKEKYDVDLVEFLSSNLSGSLRKVVLTAMRGEVIDFNSSIHTSEQATMDADSLYKAGEGRWGTDKKTFIDMLVSSPLVHVRNINKAYMKKYKVNLIHVINAKFHGDTKRALLFRVRSILEPMGLLAELFETTLNSAGKSISCCQPPGRIFYGLSAWVLRYFPLLERIVDGYSRRYHQDLRTRIQSVVKGEYCQLLLCVFDAVNKTAVCPSCAVASDPKDEWCRCCGEAMQTTKVADRKPFTRYLKTHLRVEAWRKAHEVAIALQCLHDQGVVHANLKPINLIIGRDGKGHLSELESCNRVEELASCTTKSKREELRWQAPECLNGGLSSLASDIYSLAMCIIYVVTGRPPWGSNVSDNEIKHEVCNQRAMPPRPKELSDNEWSLVNRMCEYEPSKRITADEVVQELSQLVSAKCIDVPEWYVPRQLIDYSSDIFSESNLVSRHVGRWKDAVVAVETMKKSPECNFRSVAELWFSLKHPTILQLFRACDDEDDQTFVCEYAEQGDFSRYLSEIGEISGNGVQKKQVWTILLDVALALHYLHSIGVVHGDVTYQNILVDWDNHGKLSGFMSSFKPEQQKLTCVNGHDITFDSDVYWLGQCIVSALCGHSIADNRVDAAERCDVCITDSLGHQPEIFTDPEWQLIKEMCAVDPSHRIGMADAVRRMARLIAVDAAINKIASAPPPPNQTQRSRGQANLLAVMSDYTTRNISSFDSDYDDDDESKSGIITFKCEKLRSVESPHESADEAAERYTNDLKTLLSAEVPGKSSSSHDRLNASQSQKRYRRQPKLVSSRWILSTDNIAEGTGQGPDLGFGSFAAVCCGTWLGAPVALKKLNNFDLGSVQALRQEANIWSTLRHPHIVSLFGACTKGVPLFVCEYIGGTRLDESGEKGKVFNHGKRLDQCQEDKKEKVWGYLHDAAIGLQGLHMHGVVHADLKCDNILIGGDDRAKLIDFGLSCLQTCDGGEPRGAKRWKAPECLIKRVGPTFESDIYGFGMCIIEALTGKVPWAQISDDTSVTNKVKKGMLPKQPDTTTFTQVQWEAVKRMCCQAPQARLRIDDVVRVLGFFAGRPPYINDTTLQEEVNSWTSTST
ncbi:serine/threonine protein kinase, partial [Phytophthora nicotianae]